MQEGVRSNGGRTAQGHWHVEAFAVMTYATKDMTLIERIWNSRDGVTPFIVFSPDGREMRHIAWHLDVYAPSYRPQPGQRIFVSRSREHAEALARERVEEGWEHPDCPLRAMFASQAEAVAALVEDYYQGGAAPVLVQIKPDGSWEE